MQGWMCDCISKETVAALLGTDEHDFHDSTKDRTYKNEVPNVTGGS